MKVRDVGGVKLLQLKNPWARKRWKGAYSANDAQRWTPELRKQLQYDQMGALQQDNGIFWIDYPSLLKYYQGVYINWNPQLFAHHTATHGQWPAKAAATANDSVTLGPNPQYALSVSVSVSASGQSSAAVWLLLTRHTTRRDQGKDDYLTASDELILCKV